MILDVHTDILVNFVMEGAPNPAPPEDSSLKLGRKRILDTALAATLEQSGIEVLATFNARHFEIFNFLEIVVPDDGNRPLS